MTRVPGSAGHPPRFATRLLLAQSLVLVAGALSIWLVASAIGPGIFEDHLRRAGDTRSEEETRHVEEAFSSSLLISFSVALVAAIAAALAVSWYFSRRIQRSIEHVAEASSRIAAGRYDTHIADPGLGVEFATLADTYNQLAERLDATATTRRQMLSDLSHEMRTPLATIDAHLEAIEDGVRHLDDETVTVLRSSTQRLRRLAEDIGAVSAAEESNLRLDLWPVDAAAVAASAAESARDRCESKGVRLHADLHPAGQVKVDPDRIGQVLGNLIDNALRHTPRGGSIGVSCRRIDSRVEYTVADTGQGIASEHLPYLFDRFYRVDTARDRDNGGSGIGLAIAKAIAKAHGGSISVTSTGAGHGSTFTVRLPAA